MSFLKKMTKILSIIILFGSFCLKAQTNQDALVSNRQAKKVDSHQTDFQDNRVLPLFGSKKKTDAQIMQEKKFLEQCDLHFSDRLDASKFFAERGWEYVSEGKLDTAIYRFNLCFLLNPANVDAFWGLGTVSYQQGKFEESSNLLQRGLFLAPQNSMLMVDVATVQISCFKEKRNCEDLEGALVLLNKSIQVDSLNANAFLKLSIAEYLQEHYEKSWEYMHKCRQLDLVFVDLLFIQDLLAKQPDPQGIFK
jgi:tetratricopeptide (TPR) repeat protein